jgi:hypothetical protein
MYLKKSQRISGVVVSAIWQKEKGGEVLERGALGYTSEAVCRDGDAVVKATIAGTSTIVCFVEENTASRGQIALVVTVLIPYGPKLSFEVFTVGFVGCFHRILLACKTPVLLCSILYIQKQEVYR